MMCSVFLFQTAEYWISLWVVIGLVMHWLIVKGKGVLALVYSANCWFLIELVVLFIT